MLEPRNFSDHDSNFLNAVILNRRFSGALACRGR